MSNWKFDPMHTQVEFSAKHLGMMTVRGHFAEVTATGDIHPEHPERTTVEATITTASIRTHNEQRDKDLRSSNFLEIDKYPTMAFKSTKLEMTGPDSATLTGNLTIKGNTHRVTLKVVKYGEFNDPNMGHRIGYAAETKINRKDFLRHELRHDAGREVHREQRDPDQHRRRAHRGAGSGDRLSGSAKHPAYTYIEDASVAARDHRKWTRALPLASCCGEMAQSVTGSSPPRPRRPGWRWSTDLRCY